MYWPSILIEWYVVGKIGFRVHKMIKTNLIKRFGSDRSPHQWYLLKRSTWCIKWKRKVWIYSLVRSWIWIAWYRPLRLSFNHFPWNYFKTIYKLCTKIFTFLHVLSIPVSANKFLGDKLNGKSLMLSIDAILNYFDRNTHF